MTSHILLVDDDRAIRDLLTRYLQRQGYHVSAAADAQRAAGMMRSLTFDLIVLDIMMPGESGLDFARRLPASAPPVLFLTARTEARDRIGGLETGAADYLTKPFEPRELVLRVENILKRRQKDSPQQRVALGEMEFDTAAARLFRAGNPIALKAGEQSLLAMFAAAPGRIFTREEIAARHGIATPRAVDVRINRLRHKIERDPHQPLYLQTVRGAGYVLQPGD